MLFMRFNTRIFPLLSASCSSANLSISGKKPLKSTPTKTINNNIDKALSCGTSHLCFHKCDKSNGAALSPAYKSNQCVDLVYSRPNCLRWSLPTPVNKSLLKMFLLCSVKRLVEPEYLKTKVQHLICDWEIPLVRDWFYYSKLSNGNLVECCETSSSHSPIV